MRFLITYPKEIEKELLSRLDIQIKKLEELSIKPKGLKGKLVSWQMKRMGVQSLVNMAYMKSGDNIIILEIISIIESMSSIDMLKKYGNKFRKESETIIKEAFGDLNKKIKIEAMAD